VKSRILFRYLVSEILPPFFVGLLAFTLILLVGRMLKLIELVVTRGVPLVQISKLFMLILPTFLEMTVPMAFLLAILLGLGRMSNDQELLAMKASGVSPTQILWPAATIAGVIALATFALTLFVRPAANFALKKELYNIAKHRIGTALREKVFNDDFPKILIYVEEIIPPGNIAQGVLIVDNRERSREDIILGKVARITSYEQTNTLGLRLFDGSLYEREENRPGFSQTRFNIYDFKIDFDELVGSVRQRESGPKEMPLGELLETIENKENRGVQATSERMELHQRISFGFVPLIFCILGVSLTLLPRPSRANRSWGLMLCIFWLMAYYALLSFGKALGDKSILDPVAALWLPNVVVGAIAVHFYRQALREIPLRFPRLFESAAVSAGRMAETLRARARN
jgi:lipopolysaccharide export system permease protein